MKYILCSSIILLLLAATGCAPSSGTIKNASPARIGKTLSLDAILVQTASSQSGSDAEKNLLSDFIISDLNDSGLFKNVSTNRTDLAAGNGIKIFADINQIKKVSDDARVWAGGLAGRARILVAVTVTDLATGQPVETFEVEGQSGKTAWAGTTGEAIHQAAGQITSEMVRLNAQTGE